MTSEDPEHNLFYVLNHALRSRKAEPGLFRAFQGFLYYLMRALDQLPKYEGVVYRGGNAGIDQETVRRVTTPLEGQSDGQPFRRRRWTLGLQKSSSRKTAA